MADKTVGGFMNDLKRKNLLDTFRKADEGLSNDIIVEIRLAGEFSSPYLSNLDLEYLVLPSYPSSLPIFPP
jgi:hypothetical protein